MVNGKTLVVASKIRRDDVADQVGLCLSIANCVTPAVLALTDALGQLYGQP